MFSDVYPVDKSTHRVEHNLQFTKAVISKPAPEFEGTAVVNGEFKTVSLRDYLGKYVVFFFYPLDFTFVCPTEILAFSDRIEEFRNINTEVIAASVDSHFTHLSWIKTERKAGGLGKVNIPLLSDLNHKISKDYGVYLEDLGHTLRGLFIIDGKGILRQITMNDLPVGRSVDETLRYLLLLCSCARQNINLSSRFLDLFKLSNTPILMAKSARPDGRREAQRLFQIQKMQSNISRRTIKSKNIKFINPYHQQHHNLYFLKRSINLKFASFALVANSSYKNKDNFYSKFHNKSDYA